MNTTLTINPELRDLLPPLGPAELAGLEADILRDGCTDPLTAWGEILVDGHHRYKICTEHGIDFKITQKTFESLIDAKIWMCDRQDNRRNLNLYQRAVVALKMKPVLAEKAKQNQKHSKGPGKKGLSNLTNLNTRCQLSKRFKISAGTLHMVELLEAHASESLKQSLRSGQTTINKEFTRLKAELDAQKPKTEKKARSKTTAATEQNRTEADSKKTRPAFSEEKTKAAKIETKTAKPNQEQASTSESETTPPDDSTETTVVSLKSRRKVDDKYSCGVTFEPDPDDTEFDWLTEAERKEFEAMQENCPNRLVPQIHNFTIQNIPEHSPEPLLTCLYDLFKVGYRKKLAYGLLRRMFDKDDAALARSIVDDLHNEFQNR